MISATTEPAASAAGPRVVLRFAGDPYALARELEAHFGTLFFYRLGRRRSPSPRYVYAALDAPYLLYGDRIDHEGRTVADGCEALQGCEALLNRLALESEAEGTGTAVGSLAFALSYELGARLRGVRPAGPPQPHRLLGLATRLRRVCVLDPAEGALTVESELPEDLRSIPARLASMRPLAGSGDRPGEPLTHVREPVDRERYASQIGRLRASFEAGDVYQVVLTTAVVVAPRMDLHAYFARVSDRYRAATYSYYVSAPGLQLFGNCSLPHVMLRRGEVSTRVFAGTNPHPASEGDGPALHRRMREDPKYFAEHVMLVDLERNDLGTYCRPGTVRVRRLLSPVFLGPTTYLSSDVSGAVGDGVGIGTVLLRSFPRGVVTGAPKRTALEVIASLEHRPRGFYCGAIGLYRGRARELTSNTIVTCAQRIEGTDLLSLQCGGGITNESDAEQELREVELKLEYLV